MPMRGASDIAAASGRVAPTPLRVLMVSDVYFPRINGVSSSIESFRAALRAHGVAVRLVVPRYGDEADEQDVLRVSARKVPGDPEDRIAAWPAMRDAAVHEAHGCDLIHLQTPFVAHYAGLAAARARQLPVLSTYHTLFEEYLQHYAPLVPAALLRAGARRLSRAQCNALDAVVVPSSAMCERLVDYGVRRPLHVLPTGIAPERFAHGDRLRFRVRYGIPFDAPVGLYVGRVAHEKNLGFLLEVAERVAPRLPGFVLIIAGEGPAMAALQAAVATRGLAQVVRFVGYLERRDALPDCYAGADVFVFASRTETQGLVLLEAMAAGLPLVALAAMGTIDTLAPRRGALVPPDDAAAFAQALLRLLVDGALRRCLGNEARRYSAEWCDASMAARLAGIYRVLVQQHAETRSAPHGYRDGHATDRGMQRETPP